MTTMTVKDNRSPRWAMRSLYAVAIGMNVWSLWRVFDNSPEGVIAKEQSRVYVERFARPWRERRTFRRARHEVIVEAESTIEDAKRNEKK